MDKNSEYNMIDVDDLPETTEEPLKDLKEDMTDEEERIASDMALDEFLESEHPRNKLGIFIKKIKKIIFKDALNKEENNSFITDVYLRECGDLESDSFSKKEIREELEKEKLPDDLESLEDLYKDVSLLKDEYSMGGELTRYAIEYKKELIRNKYKKLDKEKKNIINIILKNTLKGITKSDFDNLK